MFATAVGMKCRNGVRHFTDVLCILRTAGEESQGRYSGREGRCAHTIGPDGKRLFHYAALSVPADTIMAAFCYGSSKGQ